MYFNIFSPLEQFELVPVLGFCIPTPTVDKVWVFIIHNADVVCISIFLEILFLVWLSKQGKADFLYQVSQNIVRGVQVIEQLVVNLIGRTAQFNLVVVLGFFGFVLVLNIVGLVPWGFCLTAQLIITQFLAVTAVGGLVIKGIQALGIQWLSLFIPRNVPLVMLPFLTIIELISYVSRVVSLSVRLFANMVAGHALLHILLGALIKAFELEVAVFVIVLCLVVPTLLIFAIFFLELGIAFLQSYVFSVLFLIYFASSCRSH